MPLFNVTYTGHEKAIGSYNALNTNLNLTNGIILTTGYINDAIGPNNNLSIGTDNQQNGSVLLSSLISNLPTYNAAILAFDFTAEKDTFFIKYIFGSEEYFDGTPDPFFNDIFGIFIEGEGIEETKNIAVLNDSTNISILNINNENHNDIYVYNGSGNDEPFKSDSSYIQYDGFTKKLTAFSPTVIGSIYHVTICIADVGDGLVDSGVFLSANCFEYTDIAEKSSSPFNIFPNPTNSKFNIQSKDIKEIEKIELFDALGKFIESFPIENTIHLNKCYKGIYVLKITTNTTVINRIIEIID